jgi:hypothetical protein
MPQFEFRQNFSQQNFVPVLPSDEQRCLIPLYRGIRIACALLVLGPKLRRAHILHRNGDMQMNLLHE